MMRSLRHFCVMFSVVVMLVMGYAEQPSYAGSSTAIRVQEDILKDYSGQTLADAEFYNTDLEGVNFSNTNMLGAVIKGSSMKGANLSGANLSNSFLFQDDLSGTDLTNAIFEDAMLMQTTFDGATITGADFSYAVITKENLEVLCQVAGGTNPVTGMETRESLECR